MDAHPSQGRVYQINTSRGGVPKLSIAGARVNTLGIEGDYHTDQANHGGADRALCLLTLEQIQKLQQEGHPITPGSTGENITLQGIPQSELLPGSRLLLGNVEIELTAFVVPCQNIALSFSDGDFTRISAKLHPGESRIYARVLRTGQIVVGDVARVLDGNLGREP